MLILKVIDYTNHEVFEQVIDPQKDKSECIIGRTPGCDLLLNSLAVSRVHGRIIYRQGQYFFTDLGSTDGSRLNNEMLLPSQDIQLQVDDLIRICEFVLVVKSIQIPEALTQSQFNWNLGWNSSTKLTVRCVQIINETHDVKTFRFVAEPSIKFDYLPGQFVTLQLEIDGKPVSRSYSISSTPSRPHLLDISVKRVPAPVAHPDLPPGLVSNWLHDHFSVGDRLQIQGPLGRFSCGLEPPAKLLLIAAGSGITPMMAMTRWVCDRAWASDICFIYSARTPGDLVYRQELELLAQQHTNLNLGFTVTQFPSNQLWSGYRGRVDRAMVRSLAPDVSDRTVFVCGPSSFMDSIKTLLENLNFPMERYHEESFGGRPAGQVQAVGTPLSKSLEAPTQSIDQPIDQSIQITVGSPSISPIVVFRESGREVECDPEDSILEVAESAGITMANACRMGACGVCKHKLQSGTVNYVVAPTALDPKEQDEFILPCVARPLGRVVIDA